MKKIITPKRIKIWIKQICFTNSSYKILSKKEINSNINHTTRKGKRMQNKEKQIEEEQQKCLEKYEKDFENLSKEDKKLLA